MYVNFDYIQIELFHAEMEECLRLYLKILTTPNIFIKELLRETSTVAEHNQQQKNTIKFRKKKLMLAQAWFMGQEEKN